MGPNDLARSVALLSDVHGVDPMLAAVLAEPEVAAADLVVVTGDHLAGPLPGPTADRLRGLGDRLVAVRGNADRDLVTLARGEELPGAIDIDRWAAAQLDPDQVGWLAALEHPVTVQVAGFGPVVCCHGSPRDDDDVVLVDTRVPRWLEVLADLPDAVRLVVGGHTHMPYLRQVDRRLVLNPGSVGMPYGRAGGHWALLRDSAVSFHRTLLDPDALADEVVARSSFPGVRGWVDDYLRSNPSDLDALAAMGPRDGRP